MSINLTDAQTVTVRTWIEANFPGVPLTNDASQPIADALNAEEAPAVLVWRAFVPLSEITENGFTWTEVDGLTVGKARIWEWMTDTPHTRTNQRGIVPGKANVRAGLQEVFAVNSTTRPALIARSRRNGTVLEVMLAQPIADGARPLGIDATGWYVEGEINMFQVLDIRKSA